MEQPRLLARVTYSELLLAGGAARAGERGLAGEASALGRLHEMFGSNKKVPSKSSAI